MHELKRLADGHLDNRPDLTKKNAQKTKNYDKKK